MPFCKGPAKNKNTESKNMYCADPSVHTLFYKYAAQKVHYFELFAFS
jgi:hypothetical protein